MKEITRVINAEITITENMSNEDAENVKAAKADAEECVKQALQRAYGTDNVIVSIQDFEVDKEGGDIGSEIR